MVRLELMEVWVKRLQAGNMRKTRMLIITGLLLFQMGTLISEVVSAEVPRITKEELKSLLGKPDVVIIDVRLGSEWTLRDSKIKGAVRENPAAVETWAEKYPKDRSIVLYCS